MPIIAALTRSLKNIRKEKSHQPQGVNTIVKNVEHRKNGLDKMISVVPTNVTINFTTIT